MALPIKKALAAIKNPSKFKYIKYFDKLPIDEKTILVESQHASEFNGNVFYIVKYLCSSGKYRDFKVYLACTKDNKQAFAQKLNAYNIKNIELLELHSKQYYKAIASAKYLINDNTFLPFYQKKEGQVYINTWHGTPLKSLGRRIKNDAENIGNAQKNFVLADYILFPNEYTMEHIVEDYMIGSIAQGKIVYGGYPRNEIFFDEERRRELRKRLNLNDKMVYAYMPTFRGTAKQGCSKDSDESLISYLNGLDNELNDDEILYVNLHPVSKSKVDFGGFRHIKEFEKEYDTYDFLNISDCLVTDYSSVFFDYACTGRKIVLFTYDREEYLRDRGVYISLDELPYPQAGNVQELLSELRSEKEYDDSEFISQFCKYDNINASKHLCDTLILGENAGLKVEEMPSNGKESILIYAGSLAPNGITASLKNLLNTIDTGKRNYYICYNQRDIKKNRDTLFTFPEGVNYYAISGGFNLTIFETIIKALYRYKLVGTGLYIRLLQKRIKQNFEKDFDYTNFAAYIQFSGYVPNQILKFSQSEKNTVIYVHSDMLREIKSRGNQRLGVLKYAYNNYKKVAVVTQDIVEPTAKISGRSDNIQIAKNAIPHNIILKKSLDPVHFDEATETSQSRERAMEFLLDKKTKKFITVGRFSPEKGHDRLVDAFSEFSKSHNDARLVIMGGSSHKNQYSLLLNHIKEKGLSDKILLIKNVSNPYPIVKLCDFFVLSSYYEGFGLALTEADILGKSVISTDIVGPRGFMNKYGGLLVESSQEGLERGLEMLYNGEVKPMRVDYEKYNEEVIEEFEELLK